MKRIMSVENPEMRVVADAAIPIPVPLARRWREFRIRFLPALIFTGALATVALLWHHVIVAPTWGTPSLATRMPPALNGGARRHPDEAQDRQVLILNSTKARPTKLEQTHVSSATPPPG